MTVHDQGKVDLCEVKQVKVLSSSSYYLVLLDNKLAPQCSNAMASPIKGNAINVLYILVQ